MNGTFEGFVADKGADSETMMQAARYYLAERCDDITIKEMRKRIDTAVGDPAAVDRSLDYLVHDPESLEAASRALLAWAWDEPGEAIRVERAIDAAKQKLPVIEVALLAVVAMYGMFLYRTKGVKRRSIKVTQPDGSTYEADEVYYPPSLTSLTHLFSDDNDSES